ncbi:hypothetical protein [Streptomyces sp. NRRL S-1448]|uniref:hypothetical protein n=1 Tax=Streptomyces sp. NRRL S-1448 TaxID=1463883 RepID=UPI0004BE4F48|nr:hypothetical protein [Streptomyces sp. NRRL S-1448]
MALLAEHTVKARPAHGLVEVYDADAYLDDSAAAEASRQQVVAGNGYHLYLHSLQPDIKVDVTIRIWDQPQAPPKDCEGSTPVTIESATACLVINQLTFGPAGTIDLPRPGIYEGHAWWTGRNATRDYYNRTLTEHTQPERLKRAWQNNPTPERYYLDLHRTHDVPPDDEDSA